MIKEAPTAQHDKSGEWQETSGEIQWVSTEKPDSTEEKDKKEEDDEELDLNKGTLSGCDDLRKGKELPDCINSHLVLCFLSTCSLLGQDFLSVSPR